MTLLENHPILGLIPTLVLAGASIFFALHAHEKDPERSRARGTRRARRALRDHEQDYSMEAIFGSVASAILAIISFIGIFYAPLDKDQRLSFMTALATFTGALALLALARYVYLVGEESYGSKYKIVAAFISVFSLIAAAFLLTWSIVISSHVLTWIF